MRVMFLSIGRFGGKAVVVLVVLCLFIFFLSRGVRNYYEGFISVELISVNYPGKIIISREEQLRSIEDQFNRAEVVKAELTKGEFAGGEGITGPYKLVLYTRKGTRTYVFREPGSLRELSIGDIYTLKDGGKCLALQLKQLDGKNPYGEFLTWDQAENIFRKYDKARIIDFETGKSFMVQRRAGSHHADVQPLTAEDSAVMKTIYGGKWSWRRRAIIVEVRGHRIAASMNGMPHGAGAIANNDFAGHFCIHFRDSKTHSNSENLGHQIMIWKAAGVFMEQLAGAEPEQILRVMVTAMEQSDSGLASRLFATSAEWSEAKIREQLTRIKWLAVSKISRPKTETDTGSFNLIASYELADGSRFRNRRITLILNKDPQTTFWKIDPSSLEQLFSKQAAADEKDDDPGTYINWYIDNRL